MGIEVNPYASPAAVVQPPEAESVAVLEARRFRRANAGAERGLRQYTLCLCGVFLLAAGTLFMFWYTEQGAPWQQWMMLAVGSVFAVATVTGLTVNVGVRRLAAWARTPLTILCAMGLALFPIGTFVSLPILWLLYQRRGVRLLTPEYERIVRDSGEPGAGRTLAVTWIGVVLLVILIVSLIFISMLPPEFRRPPQ